MEVVLEKTGRSLLDVTAEAGLFFAQSAAKLTPPNPGRKGFTRKTQHRPIYARTDDSGRTRYIVPYRTARNHGIKWFGNKNDAKAFARIKYRGIGRAGWWASMSALGGDASGEAGTPEVKASASRWGHGQMLQVAFAPMAIITNTAPTVSDSFAAFIASEALWKSSRRMFGKMASELRKLKL